MREIQKGWGCEEIWASNDMYCAKFLHFNKGGVSSMHFHSDKHETWYVLSGEFVLKTINTIDGKMTKHSLSHGDIVELPPLLPHQLICLEEGTIIEASTKDSVNDNYRVWPGDSQK